MPAIDPNELKAGDHVGITIALAIDGTVSRVWSVPDHDGPGATHYLALVTFGHGERVFRLAEVARATLVSRGNDVPAVTHPHTAGPRGGQ